MLSFFPRDVLDEIWNLIGSVSEGFPSYSFTEIIFQWGGYLYIACNKTHAFFSSEAVRNHNLWSCQKVCEALILSQTIFILYLALTLDPIAGISMVTNCASLVAYLFFFFYYERDSMLSFS